jgi:hypothetical protein
LSSKVGRRFSEDRTSFCNSVGEDIESGKLPRRGSFEEKLLSEIQKQLFQIEEPQNGTAEI